jgi:hypothetical protein
MIFGFWAYKPEEIAKSSTIEMCLIIRCKYRKYEEKLAAKDSKVCAKGAKN